MDDLLELILSIIKQETCKLILFWKFCQLNMQLARMEIKHQDYFTFTCITTWMVC